MALVNYKLRLKHDSTTSPCGFAEPHRLVGVLSAIKGGMENCLATTYRVITGVRDLPRRWAVLTGRRGIRLAPSGVVLGFGGVLDGGGLVHGGAVKLLELRAAFACNEREFTHLYLVSSALPEFALDLARHCKASGIRFVWNQNGVGYPAWAGWRAEVFNAPMRKLLSQADAVVYQSEFCRRSADRFLGVARPMAPVLLNPVDLDVFAPATHPLPVGPVRLLAMGTQNYAQRVLSAMDAAAELLAGGIECTLTIAGSLLWAKGEQEVSRYAETRGLGERLIRRPAFSRSDAPVLCRSHHILLHPKYMDPCPTVVAEALACGLPVVGTASGGLPEMVSPECGSLIPVPEDWDAVHTPSGAEMAAAVAALLPQLASHSAAARERACSLFDAKGWIDAHAAIFSK